MLLAKKLQNRCDKRTPTTSLVACNCCNGSMILSELMSTFVMVPRITAFQTRNKTSGILVPRTIAVLQNNNLVTYTTYSINYICMTKLYQTANFYKRNENVWGSSMEKSHIGTYCKAVTEIWLSFSWLSNGFKFLVLIFSGGRLNWMLPHLSTSFLFRCFDWWWREG